MIWFQRYSRLLVCATLLLVTAGGMVTSTNSGLSVPDWPTTYGQNMFTFPLSKMVGGIFYEHGHRLIASLVGFMTIILVLWQWRVEERRWVRRLGWTALGAVILQGTLGGITVLFFLPDAISIAHAGLAQIFFCLTVTIALVTSKNWVPRSRGSAVQEFKASGVFKHAAGLTAVIYAQILLGATMRHTGAGLAIPDFPLMFGRLLPPEWTMPIAIHFAHRLGALIVVAGMFDVARRVFLHHRNEAELARPVRLLFLAVLVQATLGAYVVLTAKNEILNTLHVANGAVVLGTALVLTLRLYRASHPDLPPATARAAA